MKISKDKIIEAANKGITNSFNEYFEWSGGDWLWKAPEYLLTVNIAKELYKIEGSKFITLENNVKETLENAQAKIRGKLKEDMRPDGRCDIVFWWGRGDVRGIIEVKHVVHTYKKIEDDVIRIIRMLEKDSNMEFGMISFYIDSYYNRGNGTNKTEMKIKNILENESLLEIIKKHNLKYRYTYEEIISDEFNAAFSVSFMIHK